MNEQTLKLIREAVISGRYQFSEHALDEIDDDKLHYIDAEAAILTGTIERVQPADSTTSERYTVVGFATDLATHVAVVCRFEEVTNLLIITVYVKRDF